MYKLPELKAILKLNKIKGWAHLNKPEIVELLKEKNLLPEPEPEKVKIVKEIAPRYMHLKTIRTQPKSVEVVDSETGEVTLYPSIYKAGQAFKTNPRLITFYNGKLFMNRYLIKVLEH
jgi:hypothetical protein